MDAEIPHHLFAHNFYMFRCCSQTFYKGGRENFWTGEGVLLPKVCEIITNFFNVCLLPCSNRSKVEWGFKLFNGLQNRLPNIPVFGWLSMKKLTGDEDGCSRYPEITDLHYRNKYWQIFKFLDTNLSIDVTFHLYGAYFGRIAKQCERH